LVAALIGYQHKYARLRREAAISLEPQGIIFEHGEDNAGPAWLRPILGDDVVGASTVVRVVPSKTPRNWQEVQSSLRLFRNIHCLYIEDGSFGDEDVEWVFVPPAIAIASLSKTRVTDAGLKSLHDCESLEMLHLDKTNITDEGLKNISDLARLEHLSLEDTGVTDEGLKEIAKISRLRGLYLKNTAVSDVGIKEFYSMPNLLYVDLKGTKVSEEGKRALDRVLRENEKKRNELND
jgi:hypothetical protein